jgi:hypothetical protein
VASWLPGKPLERFFPHYYQLLIPPLVVAAGWSAAALMRSRVGIAGVALALAVTLLLEAPSYALSADEWSRRKYGPVFVESKALGEKLARELPEAYRFYDWGAETGLYFYSRRAPPIGMLSVAPLYVPGAGAGLLPRVRDSLLHARPEIVVLGVDWSPPEEIRAWIDANYTRIARVPSTNGTELWARR